MPLCVVVTRDVEDRYRGFLGSVMLEIAPGVYAYPRMSSRVRDQIWSVLSSWHAQLLGGSIVMTWSDTNSAGAMGLRSLGTPPKEVVVHEGIPLVRRELAPSQEEKTRER